MLQIGETIVSLDLLEKHFICNLLACKGSCCVHGDAGAPLTRKEIETLEKEYYLIKPFITTRGAETIDKEGIWLTDQEGDQVTPLIDGGECAFTIFEDGEARCGIEKAWEQGVITFRKPISCHLYPVRVKEYKGFTAVNYDRWDICKPALLLGEEKGVPLFRFLEQPLIRKFGEEWYQELCIAAEQLKKSNA
jgi:hypothetical protein